MCVVQALLAGSTALLATFCGGGPTELTVHVANVGDCRALLCRGGKATRLSEDHKPDRRDERARIVKAGGLVTQVRSIAYTLPWGYGKVGSGSLA